MKETEFQKQIQSFFPGFCFKTHGSNMQLRGLPDILGCWNGKFVGIELKIHPNKLTVAQSMMLQKIAKNGGLAFVFILQDADVKVFQALKNGSLHGHPHAEVLSKAHLVALFERSE